MLPGFSGSLIGTAFLDTVLADEFSGRIEIGRTARQLVRWWRRVDRTLGPASAVRHVADVGAIPLLETTGYRLVALAPNGGALVGAAELQTGTRVALCISTWGESFDRAWRLTVTTGLAHDTAWALLYSGGALRIVDATRTWARRRAIDIDLAEALADERAAAVVAALLNAAGAPGRDLGALARLVDRSEQHGVEVCTSLGAGVMESLTALAGALAEGTPARKRTAGWERAPFEQSITIVYRLLFLLFAEARAVVPTWHQVYRQAYTVDALWRRTIGSRQPRGLWKALQAMSRLAYAGCRAGDLVVTPFNGRLFSPRHTPLVESSRVPDAVVAHAVTALATRRGRAGRERVAYADLDVEQLGAVYEQVLEYEPELARSRFALARTSHERKSTGSFYTPRAITDFLVRRALHPLVAGRSAEEILRLRVLDPAMGSGAFLVSACRFLARAVEGALLADGGLPRDAPETERAAIRRTVAQRCLYGVDRNPMAVQLARLSLWLCTLSGDRPLTFLDHHLGTGDSLLGASLRDLPRAPRVGRGRSTPGDRPLPLFDADPAQPLAECVLPDRRRLACDAENTPGDVRNKERLLLALSGSGTPLAGWKRIADLWCASWFWNDAPLVPGVYADIASALSGAGAVLPAHQVSALTVRAAATAASLRFFHWELEFPEAFFTADGQRDPHGGFDCVLGNPPWEMLRADAGDDSARQRFRREHAARLHFLRGAGIYRSNGAGHANSYQLFVERALQLLRPGGRLGLIVPAGFASDRGSADLRRRVFDDACIERVIGFENRSAIFPIHRDVRFLLLTGTRGEATEHLTCAFGQNDPAWLDRLPDAAAEDPAEARLVTLSRALLESWDPAHRSIPWLKSAADLEILATVLAATPRLSDERGWNVTFGRELNATDDRPHFVPRPATLTSALLPIVEGKHLEPFRVLTEAATAAIDRGRAATLVDEHRTFARARLAYRDVASATNRVTLIAAILPEGTISTHTVYCAKEALHDAAQHCLLALLNSLVANYLVRVQVTTHVTTSLMARLPVPRPAAASTAFRELASLGRALERVGLNGHEHLYARINAIAAQLYGLTDAQYAHVVSTFPLLSEEVRRECLRHHGQATETQSHRDTHRDS